MKSSFKNVSKAIKSLSKKLGKRTASEVMGKEEYTFIVTGLHLHYMLFLFFWHILENNNVSCVFF